MTARRLPWLIPLLVLLLAVVAALSLLAGKVWIAPEALIAGDERWPIIAELRMPRVVLALLIGIYLIRALRRWLKRSSPW